MDFPQETRQLVYERLDRMAEMQNAVDPIEILANSVRGFKDMYNFRTLLYTGNYALYDHEKERLNINGYNCTTIIPTLYLLCEYFNKGPRIWQFEDFADTRRSVQHEEWDPAPHFSLTFEHKGREYMVDPFWNVFGPLSWEEDSLQIRGVKGFENVKRKYRNLTEISVSEFAGMMEHLKDPAGSLDMLVCNQMIFHDERVKGINIHLNIGYDAQENCVSTRLYIPHELLQDKAIFAHHYFDSKGRKEKVDLEFYMTQDATWSNLVNPKKVAQLRCKDYFAFKRQIKDIRKHPRYSDAPLELHEMIEQSFTPDLMPQIKARASYENTLPDKDYVFSEDDHIGYLRKLHQESIKDKKEFDQVENELFEVSWRWKLRGPEHSNDRRKIRRKMARLKNKLKEDGSVRTLNYFNPLRRDNPAYFSRYMDLFLFSQEPSGKEGDPRIGHIALFSDMIPFLEANWNQVMLRPYIKPIQEKICARFSKKTLKP